MIHRMAGERSALVSAVKAALAADGRLVECALDEGRFALQVVTVRGTFTFFLASLQKRYDTAPMGERDALVADWAKTILDQASDPATKADVAVVSKLDREDIEYKVPKPIPTGLLRLVGFLMMLPFGAMLLFKVRSEGQPALFFGSAIAAFAGMFLLRGRIPWVG